jgi:DNA polymerase-1
MTQIFRARKDIHAGVASFVFGVPIDKVDHEMRRKAKVINFGII